MNSSSRSTPPSGDQRDSREMRQELRSMGVRLTGRETHDELMDLLKQELNRQWLRSASAGNVIRRKRKPVDD
jgi:hypothetical protein